MQSTVSYNSGNRISPNDIAAISGISDDVIQRPTHQLPPTCHASCSTSSKIAFYHVSFHLTNSSPLSSVTSQLRQLGLCQSIPVKSQCYTTINSPAKYNTLCTAIVCLIATPVCTALPKLQHQRARKALCLFDWPRTSAWPSVPPGVWPQGARATDAQCGSCNLC